MSGSKHRHDETTEPEGHVGSHVPVPFLSLDANGVLVDANRKLLDLLGYRRGEIIGRKLTDIVPAEAREPFEKQLRRSEREGRIEDVECLLIGKNGGIVTVLFDGIVECGPAGKLSRAHCVIRDVTKLKTISEAHRSLVDHSIQGLAIVNADGVVFANQAAADMMGYTIDEILAFSASDLPKVMPPEDSERIQRMLMQGLAGEKVLRREEYRFVRKDGSTRTAVALATRVDIAGQPAIQIAFEDVTEQQLAERALSESESRLQAILDASPDVIALLDSDLRIQFANRSVPGVALEDFRGANALDVLPQRDRPDAERIVQSVLDEGTAGAYEITYETPAAGAVTLECRMNPIRNRQTGRVDGMVLVARDTSVRKRDEAILVAERNRAQQYLDIAGVMLVALDRNGSVTLINRKGCEILGRSEREILGSDWFDTFLVSRDRDRVRGVFVDLVAGRVESTEYFENVVRTGSGEERRIAWHNSVLRDEAGGIVGTLSSGEDITDRRAAENSLAEREAHYRALFDAAGDAVFVIKGDRFVRCNDVAVRMFGYATEHEMLGRSPWDLSPEVQPDGGPSREKGLDLLDAVAHGATQRFQWQHLHCDGTPFDVEVTLTLAEGVERPASAIAVVRDITDRKRAETQLFRNAERLRDLRTRLEQAAEDERRRIARELHDQVSQNLTALSINANAIATELQDSSPHACRRVRACVELIEETTEHIRDLTFELRPPVLDDFGLIAALEWHAERIGTQAGLTIRVGGREPQPRLAAETEMALFRIAQEALTNTVKHARASSAEVSVDIGPDSVTLRIRDDGAGFDPTETSEGGATGWGLLNMRERAEALGGTFDVHSSPKDGTALTVEVPR